MCRHHVGLYGYCVPWGVIFATGTLSSSFAISLPCHSLNSVSSSLAVEYLVLRPDPRPRYLSFLIPSYFMNWPRYSSRLAHIVRQLCYANVCPSHQVNQLRFVPRLQAQLCAYGYVASFIIEFFIPLKVKRNKVNTEENQKLSKCHLRSVEARI